MNESIELEQWLATLECPKSYVTEDVKKILQRGLLGLLWEDLPKIIKPIHKVKEIRKNILLYKIKNEPKDSSIQSIRNNVHLKEERAKLNIKIKTLEEKWQKQEFVCRQKAIELQKKQNLRNSLEAKFKILKMKHMQTVSEVENCKKIEQVCKRLMPPLEEEILDSTIYECLSLVSNLSNDPEKRKVWEKISESLKTVKVQPLWNALITARSQCTNHLIHLDLQDSEDSSTPETKSNAQISLAKLCSEHIGIIGKILVIKDKIAGSEKITMDYVTKIHEIIEVQRPDLENWLPLTLEVKKLETFQNELLKEIDNLEEELSENISVDDYLMQLMSEIRNIDEQITKCVKEVEKSFSLLKSSGTLITAAKESLEGELEKVNSLQKQEENDYFDIDLNTELIAFSNNIQMEALRKITVKGDSGVYRHLQTCFKRSHIVIEEPLKVLDSISNFPMIRSPIYYLVDYYKKYIANSVLNKHLCEDGLNNSEYSNSPFGSPVTVRRLTNSCGVLDLLRLADSVCERSYQHINEFEQILKIWSTQDVQKVVYKIFPDKLVYGSTLDEWQNRFSKLVYVLQKSNINVV